MSNKLVRCSRAGDEFHYRWAARRCLELLNSQSLLHEIYIEGDSSDDTAGEYVLDMTEIYSPNSVVDKIGYQLKYTSLRNDSPFSISELGNTLSGFSENYRDPHNVGLRIKYVIVTNRPVSEKLKEAVAEICSGKIHSSPTCKSLVKYTKLSDDELVAFCKCLEIRDGEGNLDYQQGKLRFETSMFLAGDVDNSLLNTLISMVREKAISTTNHKITIEEVLLHFDGISSLDDLFPTPSIWDEASNWVKRIQYAEIQRIITDTNRPVIIHAQGGVGKTVLLRQLSNDVPYGSVSLIYDCFGAGQYRTPHKLRHRHHDALIQLSNELARQGLCNPLLPCRNLPDQYLAAFWKRISEIITIRRKSLPTACVYIFIDAADNAEMIAQERKENCFVHELLQSDIPEGCKLIFSSRTERLDRLGIPPNITKIQLLPFDENEVLLFVKEKFDDISSLDAKEILTFTGGNPRIVANLLSKASSLQSLKDTLSPNSPKTIDECLNIQIETLMHRLQQYQACEYNQLIIICQCLAILPPSIPITVLAAAANVPIELIKSFIADLGYPLWNDHNVVHFKDEPTETWFRNKYGLSDIDLPSLIKRLKPLGTQFTYVAEVLPSLLLQNGDFDELMDLASTREGIPQENPAEQRLIYLSRLEYAVRAALKQERYYDAFRLAFLAGEEMAGNERQNELLQNYLVLTAKLLPIEQIQRFAWSKKFKRAWRGSENLYSAALLSFEPSTQNGARGLLRSARHWLNIFIEQRSKVLTRNDRLPSKDDINAGDIYIYALAVLNIDGPQACAQFIERWKPQSAIFETAIAIVKYLVDMNEIDKIEAFAMAGKDNPYIVIGSCLEMAEANLFLDGALLKSCLDLLAMTDTQLEVSSRTYDEQITPGIIAFCESAAHELLDKGKILRVLESHYLSRNRYSPYNDYNKKPNRVYLKAFSLRNCLLKAPISCDDIINKIKDPKEYNREFSTSDIERIQNELTTLLPWYELRCNLILEKNILFAEIESQYRRRGGYHYYREDIIAHERSVLFFSCVALSRKISKQILT